MRDLATAEYLGRLEATLLVRRGRRVRDFWTDVDAAFAVELRPGEPPPSVGDYLEFGAARYPHMSRLRLAQRVEAALRRTGWCLEPERRRRRPTRPRSAEPPTTSSVE